MPSIGTALRRVLLGGLGEFLGGRVYCEAPPVDAATPYIGIVAEAPLSGAEGRSISIVRITATGITWAHAKQAGREAQAALLALSGPHFGIEFVGVMKLSGEQQGKTAASAFYADLADYQVIWSAAA